MMCYWCNTRSSSVYNILEHEEHSLSSHSEVLSSKFSVRRRELDPLDGTFKYRSLHFPFTLTSIQEDLHKGKKLIIDLDELKIRYKRCHQDDSSEKVINVDRSTQTDSDLYALVTEALETLQDVGRGSDFISLLKCINEHMLQDNIAFHLVLDVAHFLTLNNVSQMRYNKTSIMFWVIVQKLFKGKGINFFRGYKAGRLSGQTDSNVQSPRECRINFIVPTDTILSRECAKYRLDAIKPGILELALDSFANAHPNQDVKLSIDGKKLAVGFSELGGEEDLSGFECPPTLQQRRDLHKEQVKTLQDVKHKVEEQVEPRVEDNNSDIKQALIIAVKNMSSRVKELREYVVKKQILLKSLTDKVTGDWKESKLAPSISYHQTKIIASTATIDSLLEGIDKLLYTVACLNGTGSNYVLGNGTVDLDKQSNYVCLREPTVDEPSSPETTKQHSSQWHELRKSAAVTGSTLYRALGLASLKEQQEHFDNKFRNIESKVSASLQKLFDYGTENEINALGTFVAKVMPVFYPTLTYIEDGCSVIKMKEGYGVFSGDGTCTDKAGNPVLTCEFKCPVPGKSRVPDVYYTLPKYYGTQVLGQMAAKGCLQYVNVCWNPQSATVICGEMDDQLWRKLWDLCEQLYGTKNPSRPTRKHKETKELMEPLTAFCRDSSFIVELPSLRGKKCQCTEIEPRSSGTDKLGKHDSHATRLNHDVSPAQVTEYLDTAIKSSHEAYELVRRPAKEVLVTVISDLDRTDKSDRHLAHAVPIQYNLAGYSLHMATVREIIKQAIDECKKRQLGVKAVAFDGQFLELSVTDDDGYPLTICKLMKKFWREVQEMPKPAKLTAIFAMVPELPAISNPDDLRAHFNLTGTSQSGLTISLRTTPQPFDPGFDIKEAVKRTENKDEVCLDEVAARTDELEHDIARDNVAETGDPQDEPSTEINGNELLSEDGAAPDNLFDSALQILKQNDATSQKWSTVGLDQFKEFVCNAESTRKRFTVQELRLILSLHVERKKSAKLLKPALVNLACSIYGDGSVVRVAKTSPKTLKEIVKTSIKNWKVLNVNIAYAVAYFPDALLKWNEKNQFSGKCTVKTDTGSRFHIHQWYAQPTCISGELLQPVIDPHHLFVNSRVRCCTKGMPSMGIHPQAWWKVAEDEKQNKTGLSMELATELRDKQSNAYAQTTFSTTVESEMRRNGHIDEANWCRLIRNWYAAVDEAGMSIDNRLKHLIEMRNHLLPYLRVGHFPPPGGYVADIPLAQFEGILCNVDRRLQLYSMVKDNRYNCRAISSLDSENIFGAFQVYCFSCSWLKWIV